MNEKKSLIPTILINEEDENNVKKNYHRKSSLTVPKLYSSNVNQNKFFRRPSTYAIPSIEIIEESSPAHSTRNNSISSNEIFDCTKDDDSIIIPKCFKNNFLITETDYNSIIKIKKLDKSSNRFGKVYKFLETNEMIEIAGTRFKLELLATWDQNTNIIQKQLTQLLDELKYFSELKHPNLIKYFGCYKTPEKLTMYREYLPNGSIEDRIEKEAIIEVLAIKWLRQSAEALKFLHNLQPPLAHKNLKASNMLLTISEDVKLSDIGHSIQINSKEDYDETSSTFPTNYRKTLLMTAPEQIKYITEPYKLTPSNDIWNLGCIFVQMLTQKLPYENELKDLLDTALYKHLEENIYLTEFQQLSYNGDTLYQNGSIEAKKIINDILIINEKDRPTAIDILNYEPLKVNKRLFDVHPLPMAKKRRYSSSKNNHDNNYDEKLVSRKITTYGKKKKVFSPLLKRFVSLDSDDINSDDEIDDKNENFFHKNNDNDNDSNDDESNENEIEIPKITDNRYIAKYFTSKLLIFLTFFVRWSILVLLTSITLFSFASFVFVGIYIIYNSINLICQCHLNEGFIVLIALILLPILILLGSLCCNNACQRYAVAEEKGKLKKSKLYYPQPQKDIKLCGVIVVVGSNHQEKNILHKKKRVDDDDPTAAMNLEKGKIVNDIAKLA
ncbi:Protein kinase domain and Protein kinase-like domain-containing protein [Strongyloides ratti]|uniref:Protein kinase domain and Protein kinase-like domain-containing protein n=1 Tax=Strongyloides ratti TaxID=34506 RepID=A0A090LN32_STRRB|nr:Protein kinase domain and Protein kinase-like domain-containing protein [Strongyloides ratti]CEF71235.1 Protein kinase domain and Protein kinase-like domain-containing protein [Strongyloides ratti]